MKIEDDSIILRPAVAEDNAFLLQVYQSTRGDDLRGLGWDEERINEFLSMQYQAQQKFFQTDYQQAADEIIMYDGECAGRLIVERRDHEVRFIDLALLPRYQNRGVGSFLIRQLQNQSRAEGKPLRLQVIRFNRAVHLLERLGFERTSETGTHFQMEWTPRVRSPGDSEG